MTNHPKVSVVIPTYNRPKSTVRAVESALHQSYRNLEVIVIDDGSTDQTLKSVSKIQDNRLKIYSHKDNKGGGAARNTGIRKSTGKYVAFLDSDDVWKQSKIKEQISYINREDYDAVYCNVCHVRESTISSIKKHLYDLVGNNKEFLEGGEELIPLVLAAQFPLGGASTLLVRKDLLFQVGLFDENLSRHQDWELLVRILQSSNIGFVNKRLVDKFNTKSPGYDTYIEAKKNFLRKYSDEILLYELETKQIISEHHFNLGKLAILENKYAKAYVHLGNSQIYTRNKILELINAFIISIVKNPR